MHKKKQKQKSDRFTDGVLVKAGKLVVWITLVAPLLFSWAIERQHNQD